MSWCFATGITDRCRRLFRMRCFCDAGQDHTPWIVEGVASRGNSSQTHESLLLFTHHFRKDVFDCGRSTKTEWIRYLYIYDSLWCERQQRKWKAVIIL
ncbi:hypothetical protein Syun_004486 [Stephania yunnanensis]|uniref:Uncharacterized protein n=1 Tax=Stephania yunnanensis TaxID=152371 RepID=A0AAP0Q2K6_9MAGN